MKKTLAAAMILALLTAVPASADEALYRQAEQHLEEGYYYTAREEFLQSQWEDWEERAAECILPWPENGEIWQNDPGLEKDVQLVLEVKQDEDSASFFRVFRDGLAVSELFVGGSGKIRLELAAGFYEIWMGKGTQWFGSAELFVGSGVILQIHKQVQDGFEGVLVALDGQGIIDRITHCFVLSAAYVAYPLPLIL